jgi:hypothetical protein
MSDFNKQMRISVDEFKQTNDRFFKIPKTIVEGEKYKEPAQFQDLKFKELTSDGMVMYSMIQDRFNLSVATYNNEMQQGKTDFSFVDEDKNIFCIMTVDELAHMLRWGKPKVIKIKKMLIAYGLLNEQRMGLNKPNRLYFLKHDEYTTTESYSQFKEKQEHFKKELSNSVVDRKFENRTSGSNNFGIPEIETQEVRKSKPIKTEYTETEITATAAKKNKKSPAAENSISKQEFEKMDSEVKAKLKSDFEAKHTGLSDYDKHELDFIMHEQSLRLREKCYAEPAYYFQFLIEDVTKAFDRWNDVRTQRNNEPEYQPSNPFTLNLDQWLK